MIPEKYRSEKSMISMDWIAFMQTYNKYLKKILTKNMTLIYFIL